MNSSLIRPLGFFELGLELGLVSPRDVADWATRRVAAVAHPDPDLCDLATADTLTTSQLLERIQRLIAAPDRREILPILFARIGRDFSEGRLSLGQVTRFLYSATVKAGVFDEEPYYEAYGFDDEYEMVQRGIQGDRGELARRVRRYLDAFGEDGQVLDSAG